MAGIMKHLKRHGRRSDMRNGGAVIQFPVGDELHPESNRIVIQAHKADVASIELWLLESVLTGELHAFALHAAPQKPREIMVLIEDIALRENAFLIVYVERRDQDHTKRVLGADEPPRVEELLLGLGFFASEEPGRPVRELRTRAEYAGPAD